MKHPDPKDPALIARMAADAHVMDLAHQLFIESCRYNYSYNFSWMGRPIIQYPQDMMAMQEIIWSVKPDLIIETGIAHGGSLVYYASLLELIGANGQVLGIDIEIRPHNRTAIESHPVFKRITLFEGSSIEDSMVQRVRDFAHGKKSVLVALDSNHTHDHVLKEMQLYSPLVTLGSYLVVFDTVVEEMPDEFFAHRPWRKGNSPKTAVHEFLKNDRRFTIDKEIEQKLLLTVAPDGYLKCIEK